MATRTIKVRVCDLCDKEHPDLKKHTVRVDRRAAVVESCPPCWEPAKTAIERLLAAGERVAVGQTG